MRSFRRDLKFYKRKKKSYEIKILGYKNHRDLKIMPVIV